MESCAKCNAALTNDQIVFILLDNICCSENCAMCVAGVIAGDADKAQEVYEMYCEEIRLGDIV